MGIKIIIKNKKARFNYEILETIEAGIVLNGDEIKSIRNNDVSINESFILIKEKEAYILNMSIKKYEFSTQKTSEPTRNRKLLLHKKQIMKLLKRVKLEKLTIVPIMLYFSNGLVKLEIGLGRGKNLIDKRETIKERDSNRKLNKIRKV
ncbi:SsrA-binding protein SmpB [Spiroplasma endosymbiont of Crioceris asparagi]|uniref:SsrA-binding protein SmpB n=1 Tax=Spiroplasma endosymbiont of Crioceris asparagi TaxID=3066286 RepID=UPI0030D23418